MKSDIDLLIGPRRSIASLSKPVTPRRLFQPDRRKTDFKTKDEEGIICLGEFSPSSSKDTPSAYPNKSSVSSNVGSFSSSKRSNKENHKYTTNLMSHPVIDLTESSCNERAKYGVSVYDKIFGSRKSFGIKNDWKKHSTARQAIRLQDKMLYKQLVDQACSRQMWNFSNETEKFIKKLSTSKMSDKDDTVVIIASSKPSCDYPKQKMIHQYKSPFLKKPDNVRLSSLQFTNPVPEYLPEKEISSVTSDDLDDSIQIVKVIKHPANMRNSQECYLRSHAVYGSNWLDKLQEKFSSKEKERLKRIERLKEENKIYKDNEEKLHRILSEQIKKQLTIQEPILPEPEFEKVEIYDFTPAMEEIVNNALSPRSDKVLSEKFNIQIRQKDLHTLLDLNWLNDEVINFYFNLIMERSKNENYPKVYVFNTFFYTHLTTKGYSAVKRWTRKVDLFSYDIVLVPIHLGVHWCLGVMDLRNSAIKYYDSMGGNNLRCLQALKNYLLDESVDKKKKSLDDDRFSIEAVKDIPQQMNGSDCGVFTCKYADCLSIDKSITFTQNNMPCIRQIMMYEILSQRLLLE